MFTYNDISNIQNIPDGGKIEFASQLNNENKSSQGSNPFTSIKMHTVSSSNVMINMLRRAAKSYTGLTLEYQEDKWFFKDNRGIYSKPEPNVLYIFVTMEDGSIHVGRRDTYSHGALANYAETVRYAGAITFNEGQCIAKWNNDSTTYLPPAKLAYQAGLKELNKFEATNFGFELDTNETGWDSDASNESSPITFAYRKAATNKGCVVSNALSEDKLQDILQKAKI